MGVRQEALFRIKAIDLKKDYVSSANWNDGIINGIAVVPSANNFGVNLPDEIQ